MTYYAKTALIGTTFQGFCDQAGTALLAGASIPFFRAGDKKRMDVKVVDWTIPAGASVAIVGDSVLNAGQTPAMAVGKDVWIDELSNTVSFILDCDYDKFYTYTADKPAGQTFYIQIRFDFVEALSGSPSGDPGQSVSIVCAANALPSATSTSGDPLEPVYVTNDELVAGLSAQADYTDDKVAAHNARENADVHPYLGLRIDGKADLAHTHVGYVLTSAVGSSIAQLVAGKVPLSQLPDGIGGVTYSTDAPAALTLTPTPGVLVAVARADHAHPMPTPADIGASPEGHNHDGVYAAYTDITDQIALHDDDDASHPYILGLIAALPANFAYTKEESDALFLTISGAASTYQTQAGMSSYLTSATAASTYQTQAGMSSYLTSATAASTYQTQAGMSSYLTSATAASTYQTQAAMSSYLTSATAASTYLAKNSVPVKVPLVCSDLDTELTTGTTVAYYRPVGAFTLAGVRGSLKNAATGTTKLEVDVKKNGVSVFSTTLTFDASSKTTVGASVPAVLSTTAIADDDEMTVDILNVGSTYGGSGLMVTLYGTESV
jgi:hypothetical protein